MKRFATALILAGLLAPPAIAAPSEVTATYRITAAGVAIGNVAESYVRQGDTYRIDSTTRAEGVLKLVRDDTVVLHSEGRVVADGLQPLLFEQKQTRDPSRNVRARFDWPKSVFHSEFRGESTTRPLPPGTQDRLSIMYQFMNITPGGERVSMYMSNGRKADLYTYRLVDSPRIETPAGEFATLHYERVTEGKNESRAQVWLARDRFNFPVRVVFEDKNGLKLEQNLVSLVTR